MARFRGKCGDKESVGARYNKLMWVTVDVTNHGGCDVLVELRNGEKIVKKATIGPGDDDTVDACRVNEVSLACHGKAKDGKCDFTYSIEAMRARFSAKCGSAEAPTASFDRKMTVVVYVKNTGDCPVEINLSKAEPNPSLPVADLVSVGKTKVKPDTSKEFSRDGVTDVRISCQGDEEDGDCRFRYTIDAS